MSPRDGRTLVYRYGEGLYLNLTNRCPTACRFCLKRSWAWRYRGHDLRLGRAEPGAEEVWRAIEEAAAVRPFRELVFCGYGESTYRLPVMLKLCERAAGELPRVRRRLNTIGLGSLLWGRDIAPEIKGRLHAAHVSLNTADPGQWRKLHAPIKACRQGGFEAALGFIRACVREGIDTAVTAVVQPGVDLAAIHALARRLGARFRPRPWID